MIRLAGRLWIGFLLALTLAQGQTSSSPNIAPDTNDTQLSEEDYAIATAAISRIFGEAHPEKLLLIDQTSTGFPPGMAAMTQFAGRAQPLLAQVPKDAKDQFEARKKSRLKIDPTQLRTSFQINTVSDDEANRLVGKGSGWESFHKSYPNTPGITLFSLPGISSDHTKALIYVGNSCDMLCGNGYFVLLGKDGDHWKVLDKVMIWIS